MFRSKPHGLFDRRNTMNRKLKNGVFAALFVTAALGAASPAMPASSKAPSSSAATQQLTSEEMAFLMGEVHRRHGDHAVLMHLSQQEMSETEGKMGPLGALVGGIGGAAGYIGGAVGSGEGSLEGLITSTLTGAAYGFVLGPSGQIMANSILASQVGFYSGAAVGFVCSGCH